MICAFNFPYYNMIRFWIMRYVMHQIEIHRPAGRKWRFLIRLISLSLAHTTIFATSVPNTILERTGQDRVHQGDHNIGNRVCFVSLDLFYSISSCLQAGPTPETNKLSNWRLYASVTTRSHLPTAQVCNPGPRVPTLLHVWMVALL